VTAGEPSDGKRRVVEALAGRNVATAARTELSISTAAIRPTRRVTRVRNGSLGLRPVSQGCCPFRADVLLSCDTAQDIYGIASSAVVDRSSSTSRTIRTRSCFR
jgi:hypothetical protein